MSGDGTESVWAAAGLAALRAETPGCGERVHLNNAGAALMPEPVLGAIRDHLELESRIGGYEAAAAREREIKAVYAEVAALIGAQARNIALVESATAAYAQALSAIPFERSDVILTSRNDYVSNQLMFLSLARRLGVVLEHAPDLPEGGVDVEALASMARRHRPRLVALTHVPTSSGLIQDIEAVGRVCRELDLLYLVDACQSVGQLPIDVGELGCDFLAATSRKFLRGPRGAGFLVVSDRLLASDLAPLFLDVHSATWTGPSDFVPEATAIRYESWEFAYALLLGTGAAARYARAIGIETIAVRARALAARLRQGLAAIPGVRVLDRGPRLAAIVTVTVAGWTPPELMHELRRRGINTSVLFHTSALFDFADKSIDSALRISPHYYNSEQEIDSFLGHLAELARQAGR